MAAKARITLGIALVLAALAVLGREVDWVFVPLMLVGLFFIVWGKEQEATENYIKGLPFGLYILRSLDLVDSVLTPRDREYEEHIKQVIGSYNSETRHSLRELLRVRNTDRIKSDHYRKFLADGFIEFPKDGPGWIKPEIRDAIKRALKV